MLASSLGLTFKASNCEQYFFGFIVWLFQEESIVPGSLSVPSNMQYNLLLMKICFRCDSWWITSLIRSLSTWFVVVHNSFLSSITKCLRKDSLSLCLWVNHMWRCDLRGRFHSTGNKPKHCIYKCIQRSINVYGHLIFIHSISQQFTLWYSMSHFQLMVSYGHHQWMMAWHSIFHPQDISNPKPSTSLMDTKAPSP